MCNPRRVNITATRDIAETWSRTVSRSVEISRAIQQDVRVTQSLEDTLSEPVLRAIEIALERGVDGWVESPAGFRHEVEGGYVLFHPDSRSLEIVAVASAVISATGEGVVDIGGTLETSLTATGNSTIYDDGFAGRTAEVGEREAREDAERQIEQERLKRLQIEQTQAEERADAQLRDRAAQNAQQQLSEQEASRASALRQEALHRMNHVGVRARQVANRLFAHGYRDAILAYATNNGAINVQCTDNDGFLDIEFNLPR